MKKILTLTVLLAAATSATYAAACTTQLYSLDVTAVSCTEALTNVGGLSGANETLTFTTFVNSGSDSSFIQASLDQSNFTGQGGFTWTDTNGGGAAIPSGTTLGYSVSITTCASGFACAITGYADQAFYGAGGTPSISVSASGVSPAALTLGSQTDDEFNAVSLQSATKSGAYTANGGTLSSFESDVFSSVTAVQTGVPEPGSMMLLGGGLFMVGLIGRKKLVRK